MAEEKAIKDMTEAEAKAHAGKLEKQLAAKDKELTETKQLNTELSDQVANLEKKVATGVDTIEVKHKGKTYKALMKHFNWKGTKYEAVELAKVKDSAVVGEILDLQGQNIFAEIK